MPPPPASVSPRVKPYLLACALVVSTAAAAADVDPKLEKAIRESLPVCTGAKVTFEELPAKLPPRFKGTLAKVESERHHCDEQTAGILSPAGNFYSGMPWNISDDEGATPADKLRNFVWRAFKMSATVSVASTPNDNGLRDFTIFQATEVGKLPLEGELDPVSGVAFLGRFRRIEDVPGQRLKVFQKFANNSPSRGPADAKVTIVEFSDFECPSCRRSSGIADTILAKYDGKVRYIRFDMPLTGHPWAFAAAIAGRAIHRQKPELFWTYKKEVYANQDKLNAFMFGDWARGFAEQHELDLKQYDADVNSEALRTELLTGAGLALTNDVRGTPTYMVNGKLVEAGDEGKDLVEYIGSLLK